MLNKLLEDIENIRQKDPAARNTFEILTCYPGLHAVLAHRVSHFFWQNKCFWLGRFTSNVSRWLTGIEIHPGAKIGRRVFMDHGMGIVIGSTAEVGDDCTIYQGVTLGGTSLERGAKRHPTLACGVVVGAGAKVLGSFTVGAYAKIGSNAVVVKPVPEGATAVGNPAHFVIKNSTVLSEVISKESEQPPLHAEDPQGELNALTQQGFQPYGNSLVDPVVQSLAELVIQLSQQQHRQKQLVEMLKSQGLDCGETPDCEKTNQLMKKILSLLLDNPELVTEDEILISKD